MPTGTLCVRASAGDALRLPVPLGEDLRTVEPGGALREGGLAGFGETHGLGERAAPEGEGEADAHECVHRA